MSAALGIGKTKLEIEALISTVLKRMPIDSSALPPDQKYSLGKGQKIEIIDYKVVDNHIKIETAQMPMFGGWYAFAAHVQINGAPELITLDQLVAIAVHTSTHRLRQLHPFINATLRRYNINTPLRIAHFIAQVAHESDGFNTNEEYASGADYEWRDDLGNVFEGDGVRFKGRGLICLTGRNWYQIFGDEIGVDLVKKPHLLEENELACLSSGWFWNRHDLNVIADGDDIRRVTRIVNGGTNGLSDRQSYLHRAKTVFGL